LDVTLIEKKLYPIVNFINILRTHFELIFWHQKISNPKQSFIIFGAKILYKKRVHKTLMKLTPIWPYFDRNKIFLSTRRRHKVSLSGQNIFFCAFAFSCGKRIACHYNDFSFSSKETNQWQSDKHLFVLLLGSKFEQKYLKWKRLD